jgi:hypothetical protein
MQAEPRANQLLDQVRDAVRLKHTAYVSLRRRKNKRLTIKVTNLQP